MARRKKQPFKSNRPGKPHGYTDAKTSARMGGVRQKGTKPELEVRRIVTELGHRYRLSNRDLPGSPDLANRSKKWAIFVHGCFWHRHEGCKRTTTPSRNRSFWEAKFARNITRDRDALAALHDLGYRTLVIWECESGEKGLIAKLDGFLQT